MTTNYADRVALIADGGSYKEGCVEGANKVATADATVTKLAETETIAEGEAVIVRALVIGKKTDGTAAAGNNLSATFRRAAAGNLTLVGAVQGATQEDSAGTPAITIAANTTTQRAEIRVTGIAAEDWQWECKWDKLKV